MRAKYIFKRIGEAVKWRLYQLKRAYQVLKFSSPREVAPPLKDRIRYFVGELRLLLPIPDRFMEKKMRIFAYGLKPISSNPEEEIYQRKGILYVVPNDRIQYGGIFTWIRQINLLSQYQEPPVLVEEGDIVIDCGACIGVASLLFAQRAGKGGKVIAIEPKDRHYEVLEKVAKLNGGKVAPIIPLKVAVYNEDRQLELFVSGSSGAHSLYKDESIAHGKIMKALTGATELVQALKIDTIVEQLGLERVDFIKMDIEGAEVDALLGAEETIKRFKPKLAICTYHRPTDPVEIRKILLNYNPNYRFKELGRGEKVLFAWDEHRHC